MISSNDHCGRWSLWLLFCVVVAGSPFVSAQDAEKAKPGRDRKSSPRDVSSAGRLGRNQLRPGGSILAIAFSPDDRLIASAGRAGLLLWSTETGELVRRLSGHPNSGSGGPSCVAFAPDGLLASGGYDWSSRLWDAGSGKQQRLLRGHRFGAHGLVLGMEVAFSPDGTRLVTGVHDGVLHVWDTKSGKRLVEINGKGMGLPIREQGKFRVMSLAVAPDNRTIAMADRSESISLFDLNAGETIGKIPSEKITARRVRFSKDGTLAWCGRPRDRSAAAMDTIYLWNVKENRLIRTLPGNERTATQSIAFSPDGSRLVSCGGNNTVCLWDVQTGDLKWTARGHSEYPWYVAYSHDGTRVASAAGDGRIRLWDEETGEDVLQRRGPSLDKVVALSISADGKAVFTGHKNRVIQTWSFDGKPGRRFRVEGDDLDWGGSVSISRDGRLVAVGHDEHVDLWDGESGEKHWSFKRLVPVDGFPVKRPATTAVVISPDHKCVVARTADRNDPSRANSVLRLISVETGKQLARINIPRRITDAPVFSADGRQFAVSTYASGMRKRGIDDVRFEIYDSATGRLVRQFQGKERFGNAFTWSADGSTLVTGTSNSRAQFWDAQTGELKYSLQGPFDGFGFSILSLTADGRKLAASSRHAQNIICVWDLETARLTHVFEASATQMQFSPDGSRLLAGQTDGTTLVLDVLGANYREVGLEPDEVVCAWQDLAGGYDTSRGNQGNYDRLNALVAGGDLTVAYLEQEVLHPNLDERDLAEIRKLIAPLAEDDLAVRRAAWDRLATFGDRVWFALSRIDPESGPADADAMKSVEGPMMEGYRYRRTHPITDLLGQIGTPRAVKLLERLAALKETPENSTMRRYAQYKLDELRKLKLRWPGKR